MMQDIIHKLLKDDPIVITGMGANGGGQASLDELWHEVLSGSSNITWESPEADPPHRYPACKLPLGLLDKSVLRSFRKLDPCVQFAGPAAQQAWDQAQLNQSDISSEQIGIYVGTSRGPVNKWAEARSQLNGSRFYPSLAAASTIASLSGALAQYFHVTGPAITSSAACASAAFSIAQAAQELLLGNVSIVLAGGAEAPLEASVARCLKEAGVVADGDDPKTLCRPFSENRSGLILGEGAAFLILERKSHAEARGAAPIAYLKGWATGSDTAGRVGLSEGGNHLSRVIKHSLIRSGLETSDIGWINAHGTGTHLNDLAESNALVETGLNSCPVSSTKPITGHCVGATPAIEAAITMKAINEAIIPFTANTEECDPSLEVNLVTRETQPMRQSNVLSLSCGFWGSQASLVFSKEA